MNNDLAAIFGGTPFVPGDHEPATDFDVYPPGEYPVLIEAAEVKQNKKETGYILKLTMQILQDGLYKGRKLFDNINLQNPSAQCVAMGIEAFTALGQAIGLQAIIDTDQLLNQVVVAHVKVKDAQNNVRTYSSAADLYVSAPAAASAAVAHAPVTTPPPSEHVYGAAPPPVYQPPVSGQPVQQGPAGAPVAPTGVTPPIQPKRPWDK